MNRNHVAPHAAPPSDRRATTRPASRVRNRGRLAEQTVFFAFVRAFLLALACAVLLWRVLQPGTLPYGPDTVSHDFPIHAWAWAELDRTGFVPLWIPQLQNGLPTLGAFAWCPFYPTNWVMALNMPTGFRLQWWALLVIAGLGMAAWGRAAGLDTPGRWTAALAFALSGHLVTLISPGHLQKAQAIAWLPWALAAVEWGLRSRRAPSAQEAVGDATPSAAPSSSSRKPSPCFATPDSHAAVMERALIGGFAAGAAVGMQFLASHTQIAYFTLLLAGWRAVWMTTGTLFEGNAAPTARDRLRDETGGERKQGGGGVATALARAVPFVPWTAALVVAAGLLGGAQWLTGMETARLSNRADGVSYTEAVATSYPPLEVLEYILPRFLGDSVRAGFNTYAGDWGERQVSDYAGTGVAILALIGLFAGTGRRRELRLWLALSAVGALVLAFGRYTPVYAFAYRHLPGFDRFRSPGTQMFVTAWALAALAGIGMTSLREVFACRTAGPRRWRWALALGGACVLALGAGGFLMGLQTGADQRATLMAAVAESARVERHRAILLGSAGGTCLWGGAFAGTLLVALLAERRRRIPQSDAGIRATETNPANTPCDATGTVPVNPPAETAAFDPRSDTLPVDRSGGCPHPAPSVLHPARWAILLPLVVLALDPIVRLQPFLSPEPLAPYFHYLTESPVDRAIARDPRIPHRLLDIGNELSIRPILHGIDTPMGYHPVTYRWMQEPMEALGLNSPGLRAIWAVDYVCAPGRLPPDDATTWTATLQTPNWTLWRDSTPTPFARFPATLTVGAMRFTAPSPQDEARLAPGINAEPAAAESPLDTDSPITIPPSGEVGPPAWLIGRAAGRSDRPAVIPPDEATRIRQWLESDAALVFDGLPPPNAPSSRLRSENTTDALRAAAHDAPRSAAWATVLGRGADHWTLRVGTAQPRWLVLSTVPAPGWRAYALGHAVDEAGRDAPVELPLWRADGCAMLVPWPGGEATLRLRYEPWSARFGIFLTLLGIVALSLWTGCRASRFVFGQ